MSLADAPLASSPVLTASELVGELEERLCAAGVPHALQEARDILAAVLDEQRFWAVLNPETPVGPDHAAEASQAAARRAQGMPFAFAVRRAAFRYLTLEVDERVLIPRQETELLVQCVLDVTAKRGGTVVDVGTGSGAIALALASEGWYERVIATDVSAGALAMAQRNAERVAAVLRTPVEFRLGADLAPLAGHRVRAIVSNPPYITAREVQFLPASVRDWEPVVALHGGADGLTPTRRLVRQAGDILESGGWLALEIDERRGRESAELLTADGRYEDVSLRLDHAGRERILLARRTNT